MESGTSAVVAFLLSLIVFGPILGQLDSGWGGGDMLSTYVNSVDWGGFSYRVTSQFGFPLGMNLNYFPGIDVTENTFALLVNAVTGSTFLGINLLVLVSFPLVAALAYLAIRMTGAQGPVAIALAVAFTFIPFHWGRALGHTYLSTLYSAVVGLALVLLVGSGQFERLVRAGGRRRILTWTVVTVMAVTVAWTGVYYAAFTLILGVAAILWRVAQRASSRALVLDTLPFLGVGVLSAVAFIPSLTTLRSDPPLASLGERVPYESVVYAGNLAMALMPLPQSSLPGLDFYNRSVVEAFAAAPFGENTAITNHGTWITTAALLTMLVALVARSRSRTLSSPRLPSREGAPVTLGFVSYLTIVVLLFFVPWGLNYLFAGTVTAQIRAWNRLLPVLLLLFLLGAAAAIHRTRMATRLVIAVPVALVILGLTVIDSVYPFRAAYAGSVADAGAATSAGRDYAMRVNSAVPADCGVLQLPYVPYPEYGSLEDLGDYEHFWPAITNPGKEWSYGSVKYTDASVWAAQLPQLPNDAQVDLLSAAGFCGIHLDIRGYTSDQLAAVQRDLARRFGAPLVTGYEGTWEFYGIGTRDPSSSVSAADTEAFLHQPFLGADPATTLPRETALENSWWWTTADQSTFTLSPTSAAWPLRSVTGAVSAPRCGPRPVTLTLSAGEQSVMTTVVARPDEQASFHLALPTPTFEPAALSVYSPGEPCAAYRPAHPQFARVLDLSAR